MGVKLNLTTKNVKNQRYGEWDITMAKETKLKSLFDKQ